MALITSDCVGSLTTNSDFRVTGVNIGTSTSAAIGGFSSKINEADCYYSYIGPQSQNQIYQVVVDYKYFQPVKPNKSLIPKHFNSMNCEGPNDVIQEARELALDESEKALQEVGFKTKNGRWTEEAMIVMLEALADEKKEVIVEKAKKILERRKEKRAAKKC